MCSTVPRTYVFRYKVLEILKASLKDKKENWLIWCYILYGRLKQEATASLYSLLLGETKRRK